MSALAVCGSIIPKKRIFLIVIFHMH